MDQTTDDDSLTGVVLLLLILTVVGIPIIIMVNSMKSSPKQKKLYRHNYILTAKTGEIQVTGWMEKENHDIFMLGMNEAKATGIVCQGTDFVETKVIDIAKGIEHDKEST